MEAFPKLYKKTSTGAIQEWEVYVDDTGCSPVIVTKYGQLGGKIQTSTELITEGKNIGRSNETSPMQQAVLKLNPIGKNSSRKDMLIILKMPKKVSSMQLLKAVLFQCLLINIVNRVIR